MGDTSKRYANDWRRSSAQRLSHDDANRRHGPRAEGTETMPGRGLNPTTRGKGRRTLADTRWERESDSYSSSSFLKWDKQRDFPPERRRGEGQQRERERPLSPGAVSSSASSLQKLQIDGGKWANKTPSATTTASSSHGHLVRNSTRQACDVEGSELGSERHSVATKDKACGRCSQMCPPEEVVKRQQENDVSIYEIDFAKDSSAISSQLAVKKYRRSAAGRDIGDPWQLRTSAALLRSVQYLLQLVADCTKDELARFTRSRAPFSPRPTDFLSVHNFVSDRLRCVLQEITIQQDHMDDNMVKCLIYMSRYYACATYQIASVPVISKPQEAATKRELPSRTTLQQFQRQSKPSAYAKLQPDAVISLKMHVEHFMGTLGTLRQCLLEEDIHKWDSCLSSTERLEVAARAFGLEILLGLHGGGHSLNFTAMSSALLHHPSAQLALRFVVAKETNNFVGFFRLYADCPAMEQALISLHLPYIWERQLESMNRSFLRQEGFPIQDLCEIWCNMSEDAAERLCQHYGFEPERINRAGMLGREIGFKNSTFKPTLTIASGTATSTSALDGALRADAFCDARKSLRRGLLARKTSDLYLRNGDEMRKEGEQDVALLLSDITAVMALPFSSLDFRRKRVASASSDSTAEIPLATRTEL